MQTVVFRDRCVIGVEGNSECIQRCLIPEVPLGVLVAPSITGRGANVVAAAGVVVITAAAATEPVFGFSRWRLQRL